MIINSQKITKKYKNKEVLKGIDFKVGEGEVHAILGKNGAGKSTFIKIALGLISPTAGKITIFDEKPGIKNYKIGYLSENITLYPHLSAKDNLKVAAYSSNEILSNFEIADILEKVSLADTGNKASIEFSLGMKRRLQLAMATMVKKVDFLILDEPTNGLDINGLLWLKSYLKEIKENGVSILLASHAIFDLQDCITDYAIMKEGIIAKQGRWYEEQEIKQGINILVNKEEIAKTINLLKLNKFQFTIIADGDIFLKTDMKYKEISKLLYMENIIPENISVIKNSLEKIYLETIGEAK